MFIIRRYWNDIMYEQKGPVSGGLAIELAALWLKDKRTLKIKIIRVPHGTD